jgi:hypothetical protein
MSFAPGQVGRVLARAAILAAFVLGGASSGSGQTIQSNDLVRAATRVAKDANYEFSEQASYSGGAAALLQPWTAAGTSLAPDHFEDTQTIGSTKLTLVEVAGQFWIKSEHSAFSRVPPGSLPENLGSPEPLLRWLAGATLDRQDGDELYFHALTSKSVDLVDFAGKATVHGEALIDLGSVRKVSLTEPLMAGTTFSFTVAFSRIGNAPHSSAP